MNKDRIEGKVKDVAGRIERQTGEWTDDPQKQVGGAKKQVEGKVQNAVGKVKDAAKDNKSKPPQRVPDSTVRDESEEEELRSRR